MLQIAISALLLCGVLASYDPYLDMAETYRMQLLHDALDKYISDSQQISGRNMDAEASWSDLNAASDEKATIHDDQLYSSAHQRDQEHIEHNDLHGFQSVSGGTGEGAPNNKQVKSDKHLPAYCNPPNPCPMGKGTDENCVQNFENTAANNQKLLSQQVCPCDTEHMFSCPAGSQTVSTKTQADLKQMAVNKAIDEMSKMENADQNFSETSDQGNPHLQGDHIDVAAKKDPGLAKN